jgi:hypothetical protein
MCGVKLKRNGSTILATHVRDSSGHTNGPHLFK